MRCVAVIEANRPGLDSVILWDRNDQLVAFAYQDGKVMMTRPLNATTLDDAVTEVQHNFQITTGQLSRISDWTNRSIQPEPLAPATNRWE